MERRRLGRTDMDVSALRSPQTVMSRGSPRTYFSCSCLTPIRSAHFGQILKAEMVQSLGIRSLLPPLEPTA